MADILLVSLESVRHDVRQFVLANFVFGDASPIPGDDDSFLETGVIDSTGVLELVAFLEERFAIRVSDEELVPENLDSMNRIAAFVCRKVPS